MVVRLMVIEIMTLMMDRIITMIWYGAAGGRFGQGGAPIGYQQGASGGNSGYNTQYGYSNGLEIIHVKSLFQWILSLKMDGFI